MLLLPISGSRVIQALVATTQHASASSHLSLATVLLQDVLVRSALDV